MYPTARVIDTGKFGRMNNGWMCARATELNRLRRPIKSYI